MNRGATAIERRGLIAMAIVLLIAVAAIAVWRGDRPSELSEPTEETLSVAARADSIARADSVAAASTVKSAARRSKKSTKSKTKAPRKNRDIRGEEIPKPQYQTPQNER